MATGDVTVRLSEVGLAAQPDAQAGEGDRALDEYVADAEKRDRAAMSRGRMTPDEAERARQSRSSAEAARQAEHPMPDPWDAWRQQKAPEMFEAEVTNRG